MKALESRNGNEIEDLSWNFWNEVSLKHVQLVFHQRMRRLGWVSESDGEHAPE
jgi:hypothetical protein